MDSIGFSAANKGHSHVRSSEYDDCVIVGEP